MGIVRVEGDTYPVGTGLDSVRMVQGQTLVFTIYKISDSSSLKVDIDSQTVAIIDRRAVVGLISLLLDNIAVLGLVANAVVALSDMLVEVVAILRDKTEKEVLVIAAGTALALRITNSYLCEELGVAQLAPFVDKVTKH